MVAQMQARSITLGIQLIPIQLARNAALLALGEAQSVVNFLPNSAIQGCQALGDLQRDLNDGFQRATADLEDLTRDATRMLSVKNELDADIEQLQAQLTQFSEYVDEITNCLAVVQGAQ